MKKFSVLFICLFFCGIFTSVYAQSSGETFIPEQLLPENTLAVCVFPNVQETVEKFKQTLLFEILSSESYSASSVPPSNSPRIGPSTESISISEKIQQDFAIFAEEFEQNAGFRLSELWAIFHKSLALALIDISSGETSKAPSPRFALIADVSDSVDALKNLLATVIVPGIQKKEPMVEFRVESFEGRDIYVVANKQFQGYYTFLGNAFVLALEQGTIQKIISVSKPVLSPSTSLGINSVEGTDVEESLFNALSYRSVVGDTHEDNHEARLYLDIRNIWLKLRPYLRQTCSNASSLENTIILDLFDQNNLQSLFWTFSYKDRGGYERMFFRMKPQILNKSPVFPANSIDLLNTLVTMGNRTFISDQIVPANVVYYRTGSVNLLEIWQQLSTLINASPYPQQIEQFTSWVRSLEDMFHLNIEKELLRAFDQEFAIGCDAGELRHRFAREKPSFEDFPVFVLFQVKDKDLLEGAFQKMSSPLNIGTHQEVYQSTEIQSITIPGRIAPLRVYTAFVKDFFVVSLSRTLMQEVITASQQGSSLATTADYRQLSPYFPASGYSKGYINIRKLSGLIRRFLNRRNQAEPPLQENTSALALDVTVLAEQLSGMMWMTTFISDGLLTESFSPVGGTVAGITLVWLGLSLLK